MKLVKMVWKKTGKTKDGKDYHYKTYYLVADNGTRVPINPNSDLDKYAYTKLDMLVNETEYQK